MNNEAKEFSEAVYNLKAEIWKVIEPKVKWLVIKLSKILESKQ